MINESRDKNASFFTILHVASILGARQVLRGNIWINILIIFIMILTFLSLVVISGILVGLLEGSLKANREQYSSDIFIDVPVGKNSIQNTYNIVSILDNTDEVVGYTVRYNIGSTIEANYQSRRDFSELPNSVGVVLNGIDPVDENNITNLGDYIIEGEMLESDESGYILLGSTLLSQYSAFSDLFEPLENVKIGSRIKVTATGGEMDFSGDIIGQDQNKTNTQEFIVKGFIKSKVDMVSIAAYITDADYRRLTGDMSLHAQEIAVKTRDDISDVDVKNILLSYDLGQFARIRTAEESIPKFLDTMKATFSLLGTAIGSIGLVVSAISIFIVIYINALTRRKYIGILKGIGISRGAIQMAYVMQAIFYVIVGSLLAIIIIYAVLIPFFNAHPINFPFSDGILVAPVSSTFIKFLVLFFVTTLAGFIPAWLIVRGNTLDSILQR